MLSQESGYKPENIFVQEGPNKGALAAEYIPGEYVEVAPDSPHEVGEETQVVDGLPRVLTVKEDKAREDYLWKKPTMLGTLDDNALMTGEVARRFMESGDVPTVILEGGDSLPEELKRRLSNVLERELKSFLQNEIEKATLRAHRDLLDERKKETA